LFWIALALVLAGGVGAYVYLMGTVVSDDEAHKSTADLEDDAKKKAAQILELVKRAEKPDELLNADHVRLVKEYKARLEAQAKGVREAWKDKKLDLRFENVPTESSTKFDTWLGDLRTKLTDQAAKANLQLPQDFDVLTFARASTDENSTDPMRHRAYRVRQMAIVEEVVGLLCKKYGKQPILKFAAENATPEPQETPEVGPLVLERIQIWPAQEWVVKSATDRTTAGTSSTTTTAEDRIRSWQEDAVKRAGRNVTSVSRMYTMPDLPYAITAVDVQFTAPLSIVPAVAQALESSTRYVAVTTRLDYQRATTPFPALTEPKLAKAEAVPGMNTHYQEGPVRALLSLDLYEYDAGREKAIKEKLATDAAALAKRDRDQRTNREQTKDSNH
jgi:hypothetical protein